MSHPGARPAISDYIPARYRGAPAPTLQADDRERLEYLRRRLLEALPATPGGGEQAAEYLLLVIERLADRGDDWALRVQRYWALSLVPGIAAGRPHP